MKTLFMLLTLSIVLLSGCHTDNLHPDMMPPAEPTGIRTLTGDNLIELFWNPSPDPDVAGYNVFVSTSYNGPYNIIGSTAYPHFIDGGAVNGNTYFYAISAYDFDGNESGLSKDVAYDVPRPEGYDVVLNDYRMYPNSSGYDFSSYAVIPYDALGVDMFFENYNGTLYMDVYEDTDIQDMGPTNSILDISTAPAGGWSATHDAVLAVGHTYVVWTFDDHYAKFRVTALSAGRVAFDWAYQLQKSNPMLKRAAGTTDRSSIIRAGHTH